MIEVIDVKFHKTKEIYPYQVDALEVKKGDVCVVETRKGIDIGTAFTNGRMCSGNQFPQPLNKIIRLATEEDTHKKKKLNDKCRNALKVCKQKIKERDLKMKAVMVDSTLDSSRMTFYFTSLQRVDFRELVKDLARIYKTRIEMRQIGVRDEAKKIGGYGVCAGPLCCATFLKDFKTVSIRMAKEQNLSLSPTKISGMCGRLMCCLTYEQDSLMDMPLPAVGERFTFNKEDVVVISVNQKKGILKIRSKSGKTIEINKKEYIDKVVIYSHKNCDTCNKKH